VSNFERIMKITLVISSLSPGGAERVMTNIANYWAEKGWDVTLLTLDRQATPPHYELHATVRHERIYPKASSEPSPSFRAVRQSWLRRNSAAQCFHAVRMVWRLRKAIKKSQPDIAISFLDKVNVLTLIATLGLGVPVVVSERIDPNHYRFGGTTWLWLRRLLYPKAACVVTQTKSAMQYFPPDVQQRGQVIPNPMRIPVQRCAVVPTREGDNGHTVIAMGRLVPQKGMDLLLQAFAQVAEKHPDWTLDIWGQGVDRKALETLASSLGLDGRARFRGVTKDTFGEFRRADLFVLSSRFEGFPNVLCEAMACGLPVISFDCPSGPAEIIHDRMDGILVPPEDTDALAGVLDDLMGNPELRDRLASKASETVQHWKIDRIMAEWEALIERETRSATGN
jgi:GalNAc-alpha-(1->4)-GalNAc-alpha-(1->3)-diNAcBac-PP-undecaprenol alpha-1,4-N-acetyl-D-galactosaminyltransferase